MGPSNNSSPPAAPDYGRSAQQGIDVMLRNLPALLEAEAAARGSTDPQRIEDQQRLQELYGPIQVQQQLDALHQFDPESAGIRTDLAKHIQDDLASGYNLPPEYARQIEQNVRGAQAARGNILGAGPISVEAGLKGKAALDLYQQHLTNAGNFLAGPTPEQQALAIQGVQPDRSMAYVNPGAGTQGANFALGNYQNLLAQYQLSGSQRNPWQNALGGAASGAAAGTAISPGWGTLIGGAVGGAAGYFSDSRLKENIRHICVTMMGVPMVMFNYKGNNRVFIGTLAEDVKRVRANAVIDDPSGFLKVDYNQLDIPLYELKEENLWRGSQR